MPSNAENCYTANIGDIRMPKVSYIRHVTYCREIFVHVDVHTRRLSEAEEDKAGCSLGCCRQGHSRRIGRIKEGMELNERRRSLVRSWPKVNIKFIARRQSRTSSGPNN